MTISLANNFGENLIINGLMDIWQRNITFTSIANATYGADRFIYEKVGTMVHDLNRSVDVPNNSVAKYSAFLNVTTAQPSLGVGDFVSYSQRIEGYNLRKIKGKDFVVNFKVKSPKTGIHCASFRNGANDKSYVVEYTVNVANTWESKSIRVKHDATGTWDYVENLGLNVTWVLGAGTNFHTTANSWQIGNFLSTANQVNCVDAINNEFRITEVSIHVGLQEIPFEDLMRGYAHELSLCQRYFSKTYDIDVPVGSITSFSGGVVAGNTDTVGSADLRFAFPTIMRTVPIKTRYNPFTGGISTVAHRHDNGTTAVITSPLTSSREIYETAYSGTAEWRFCIHFSADAEL